MHAGSRYHRINYTEKRKEKLLQISDSITQTTRTKLPNDLVVIITIAMMMMMMMMTMT